MKLQIVKAVAIKPDIIRFNVELFVKQEDGESVLAGEYQISESIEDYLKTTFNPDDLSQVQMELDIMGLQQMLTDRVAQMQYTAMLASKLSDHSWIAIEASDGDTTDENQEPSVVSK